MKRIYRIICFNNSFNFQWHFQLDWCIMNTGDMKFHSSYIIPPFGCFRKGAAISFHNKKMRSRFSRLLIFRYGTFFTAPSFLDASKRYQLMKKVINTVLYIMRQIG